MILSAAMSIDGYLDDASPERLLLSNTEDLDRVDEVRAGVDAILVGANTIRRDNPRLLVNSTERRTARLTRGLPEYPLKVTVTKTGSLDESANFWHSGGERLVLTVDGTAAELADRFKGLADVVSVGLEFHWGAALDELGRRGVRRLLVEGGGTIHTQLMASDLADELHLAIAPLLVGDPAAPRLLGPAQFPGGSTSRMRLVESRTVGDVVFIRYAPKDRP
ncbi:MAG TPA: dihydrofolate reductase family protein [Kineosporiaceae bacterium]